MKMYILCIGKPCITLVINIFDIRMIVKGLASFFKTAGDVWDRCPATRASSGMQVNGSIVYWMLVY